MSILRVNLVLSVALFNFATAIGQTPPISVPLPPQFPSEDKSLMDASSAFDKKKPPVPEPLPAQPIEALPLPKEAIPGPEVRAAPDSQPIPDQSQLVSILKRKLPVENETLPVRDAPEWFQQLMQRIVRENVPDKYVQEKDWGKTDRRWDGLHVKRRGTLNWSTKRKWKEVNHGTWKRYEVTQISPEENLIMRIENVRDAGAGKVGFDIRLTSRLHVSGRLAKWTKGVQIYNISADADAYVELQMQCNVAIKLDIRRFPPDVILTPSVQHADIDVKEFQLHQLSKLRGPLVRELSGSVHRALLEKIDEKREQLPSKINRQIAKNQDKMRLSLADFASDQWQALTRSSSGDQDDAEAPRTEGDDKTNGETKDGWQIRSQASRSARRPGYEKLDPRSDRTARAPVKLLDLVPADGGSTLR